MIRGGVGFQWLFHAEQAAYVGHKLLQALEEGDLLLAVHGGRRAAGRQLVEGVGQPLVDDGVSLRGEQSLHQLRVLRLTQRKENRPSLCQSKRFNSTARITDNRRVSMTTVYPLEGRDIFWTVKRLLRMVTIHP